MAELSSTSSLVPRETERPSSVLTTFYSFKGGVGRTQSLYNVAARLTALRRKVLMVDVDLEAPGLSITLDEERRRSKEGFAEIAAALLDDLETTFAEQETLEYLQALKARYAARIQRALHDLEPPMPPKNEDLAERLQREMGVQIPAEGSLALLSVGRVGTDYTQQVAQLPLAEAYDDGLDAVNQAVAKSLVEDFHTPVNRDRLHTRGHVFAALFRELLRTVAVPNRRDETFDHVLIDSRSGLADVGGLCLLGLAETRVVLTGLNEQNVTGTKMVLDDVAEVDAAARDASHLITVFSPVPEGEVDLLAKRLESAKDTLGVSEDQVRLLHYHPRIALEEKPFAQPFHEYTRIYDEYEDLTDHLLALTGSDAGSLVSDALDRFRSESEQLLDGPNTEEEDRYERLVNELIPAAFLDEDHVESVVDGLCSQMMRSGPYEQEATLIFDLWIGLSSGENRVLGTTASYHGMVGEEVAPDIQKSENLFNRSFKIYEEIVEDNPQEEWAWDYWGTSLGKFARIVEDSDPDRAESLYHDASEKHQKAIEMDSERHEAWNNWGMDLAGLAQLTQHENLDRAESLYKKSFEKYQTAIEINSNDTSAWLNQGIQRFRLYKILRSHGRERPADEVLTDAIDKLTESLSHGGGETALYWLTITLAERDKGDDIKKASNHLTTLLDENSAFVFWFEDEDAEVVQHHPELREILAEYREKAEEAEEDREETDLPDDVSPNPQNPSPN